MIRVHCQSVTSQTTAASVAFAMLFAWTGLEVSHSGPVFGADDDFVTEESTDSNQPPDIRLNNAVDRQLYVSLFGDAFTKLRRDLDAQIEKKVRGIATDYKLTKAEYESIVLAARSDRIRFDREIAELRAAYESSQKSRKELLELLSAAQTKLRNGTVRPNPDSFFEKKTRSILAGKTKIPHTGEHHVFSSDLLRNRHKADVDAAVRAVERTVDLRPPQREALVDLLSKETQPAKVFGDFDDIVVKYRLSQLPEDKLKPLFDQDQWPKVLLVLDSFREFGPFLKRHALIANEPAIDHAVMTGRRELTRPAVKRGEN